MSLTLSIETTTHVFSCALHLDGKLIAAKESLEPQSTATKLAPAIEELFSEVEYQKKQLSAVVVASGPGSYTGLRIGTATAKGICYALNVPLISVNSLHLLGYQVSFQQNISNNEKSLLCPMLDARRMEVYCMTLDNELKIVSETEAKVLDENSFQSELENQVVYFFGDGSAKFESVVKNENARFIKSIYPMASFLGRLGYEKFRKKEFEDLGTYEPFYLKDFVIKKPNSVS
jgi:tRNA threonylcarbamoyladenosine biosynthesis protein TsaB